MGAVSITKSIGNPIEMALDIAILVSQIAIFVWLWTMDTALWDVYKYVFHVQSHGSQTPLLTTLILIPSSHEFIFQLA